MSYEGEKYKLYSLKNIESASMGIITMDVGPYASLQVAPRWRLGAKLLVGDRITTNSTFNAYSELNSEYRAMFDEAHTEGLITDDEYAEITEGVHDTEFMSIETSHALNLGVGLSVTYAVKKNSALKLYIDYGHSAPKYTYHFFNRMDLYDDDADDVYIEDTFVRRTSMNDFNVGISMTVML